MSEVFVPVSGFDVVAPQVIVVGGLTGTGKSLVASSIVDSLNAADVHAFLVEEGERIPDVVPGEAVAVVVTHANHALEALLRLKDGLAGAGVFPRTVVMTSYDSRLPFTDPSRYSYEVVRVDDGLRAAALV